ncbi:MAG: molybdenum cofactor cytidylyltransferase [Oleiphilaceae bacterium]|jgi:molybdenum cofactor cytidylyltransferase
MKKNTATFSVVILAAGESKRFGSAKQLADFCGEPLLLAIIRKVEACGVRPHIALGANIKLIRLHKTFLPFKEMVIDVQNWQLGLAESIKESVAFFGGKQINGIIFLLGDQPLIDSEYLKHFFSRVEKYPSSLLCTAYATEKHNFGVPAYFPKEYFEYLLLLTGDQGAKRILQAHNPYILNYAGSLLDIDEPDDLAHAKLMTCKAKSLIRRT